MPDLRVVLSPEHDAHGWRSYEDWLPSLQPAQRPWFAALRQARSTGRPLFLTDGTEPAAQRN